MKKTKENVYVVIDTPKKAKKVKKVLDIFGEKIERYTNETLSDYNKPWTTNSKGVPALYYSNRSGFIGEHAHSIKDRERVSIKELKQILAVEHLKEGDVVVCRNKKADTHIFEIEKKFGNSVTYEKRYSFVDSKTAEYVGSWTLDYFLRYATEEEKALLENELTIADYKLGVWYKSKNGSLIYFNDTENTYGFFADGEFYDKIEWVSEFKANGFHKPGNWVEATKEEVEKALIKEAKKRGYADGVKVICLGHKIECTIAKSENEIIYHSEWNKLWFGEISDRPSFAVVVFQDGKWAEIVEPVFVESAPLSVTIETKDIAVIEQLHDLLLDVHGYSLDYKLLRDARELAQKLTKLI